MRTGLEEEDNRSNGEGIAEEDDQVTETDRSQEQEVPESQCPLERTRRHVFIDHFLERGFKWSTEERRCAPSIEISADGMRANRPANQGKNPAVLSSEPLSTDRSHFRVQVCLWIRNPWTF